MGSHNAVLSILSHGASMTNSPLKYRRNSGLRFVGSSHGVSGLRYSRNPFTGQKRQLYVLPARRVNRITPMPHTSTGSA